MLANLPWPHVILGLAAALGVLVIYDVFYVWPIHRRISALLDRCNGLERSLADALGELPARLAATEQRTREDFGRISERLGQLELQIEARSYEQAIGCAERGEDAARLISCFGLTEGEAELVTLLHGERAGQPDSRKHPNAG